MPKDPADVSSDAEDPDILVPESVTSLSCSGCRKSAAGGFGIPKPNALTGVGKCIC